MAAKIQTALVFRSTEIEGLKAELNDFAQVVYDFAGSLKTDFAARPKPSSIAAINPAALGFGQLHKFNLASGQILDVLLPRPDSRNGGLYIDVVRQSTTGTIVFHAVDCLLNGFAKLWLPASIGLTRITFDSENYFSSPQMAADWSAGL